MMVGERTSDDPDEDRRKTQTARAKTTCAGSNKERRDRKGKDDDDFAKKGDTTRAETKGYGSNSRVNRGARLSQEAKYGQ